mgnify:CR=1 FL=1
MARVIHAIIVCLALAITTCGHAQSNYAELKGALEWIPRLSHTDKDNNETLLNTSDPAWHVTATFGWPVNETLSLETDVSVGRKQWNEIDGDAATGTTEDSNYASAMVNAMVMPRLTDELLLGLGIGGGFVYTDFETDLIPAADDNELLMPGYQLKAKIIFEADSTKNYVFEAGYQGSLYGNYSSDDTGSYGHVWTAVGIGYKF